MIDAREERREERQIVAREAEADRRHAERDASDPRSPLYASARRWLRLHEKHDRSIDR